MSDRPLPQFIARARPLVRWRYAIIVIVGVAYSVSHLRGPERDWIFFLHGNELLFGQHRLPTLDLPGGLHIYANYPVLQIGPLALLAVTPFRPFGELGNEVLIGVLTAAGIGLVVYLEHIAKRMSGRSEREIAFIEFTTLIGGTAVMAAWFAVATQWAHVDDVMVLGFACLAISAAARQRAWLLGLAIGLGVASKPWGMIMLPLILTLPWRIWWKAVAAAGVIGAITWLPFIIADTGTFEALKPTVRMGDDSVLHLVGIGEPPDWIRPVQFAGSLLVGVLAVWRGRWAAVLLVGIPARSRTTRVDSCWRPSRGTSCDRRRRSRSGRWSRSGCWRCSASTSSPQPVKRSLGWRSPSV
jgi:hypothetical protein